MLRSLTHRPFWVNLLAAIVIVALMVFIFLQFLSLITRHGQYLTVPSVIGKNTPDAIRFLESKGFEVIIQDSVYIDTAKRGIILKQLPDPNSTVKINRTVFLTVTRVTLPLVDMPALEGKTLNFALDIIRRSHLSLGDTIYKPDFMRGSVLEQLYRGNKITSGTKLPWGSKIDLIIGSGLDDQRILVPNLIGLSFGEAKILLEQHGISLGGIIVEPNITDTLSSFVEWQSPPRFTEDDQPVYMQAGQLMDVKLTKAMKIIEDSTKIN
ncbi:MAG: PASTA domain-containing protein [Ferruginibacter sp.]